MRHFFFFLLFFSIFVYTGKAQDNFNGFTDFKRVSTSQALVHFSVFTDDEFNIDDFNELLLKTSGISSSNYTKETGRFRFKSVINKSISAEDIKIMLAQYNLKIDPEALSDKNNEADLIKDIPRSEEQIIAPHYPDIVNTGNPDIDASNFEKAKQEWIKNYPEEVEKLTERSYKMSTGIIIPNKEKE